MARPIEGSLSEIPVKVLKAVSPLQP